MITKTNNYYLLNLNPWAILRTIRAANFIISLLLFLKLHLLRRVILRSFFIILILYSWSLGYRSEFKAEGLLNCYLSDGLKTSFILFIRSEVFFFFSFFWSYFHFFLNPLSEVGSQWPPSLVESFDYSNVPLINRIILLSSGVTVTARHNFLNKSNLILSSIWLALTVLLGVVFTYLQALEYNNSFFAIRDSTFGSRFFMLTGFHGLHVIIGTIFLTRILLNYTKTLTDSNRRIGFEIARWYWHFVDVVWLFLFYSIYYLTNI